MSQTQSWHTPHLLALRCQSRGHASVQGSRGDGVQLPSQEEENVEFGKKVADCATRLPSPPSPLHAPIACDMLSVTLGKSMKVGTGSALPPLYPCKPGISRTISKNDTELGEVAAWFVVKCLMAASSGKSL